VPLARRGRIALELAGFTDDSGQDSLLALALDVHWPVAQRTFADARVPMAGFFPGNVMLGVDRVSRLDPRGFFAYGVQVGVPLVTKRSSQDRLFPFSYAHGLWNMHEYRSDFLPIKLAAGYERLIGAAMTFRLDLEPVLSIPIGTYGYNAAFALQHAVELQYGHSLGFGLRVQGVAATEDAIRSDAYDPYQLSIEPFVVARRAMGFARLGLLMPVDGSVAGPAFGQAWGLRLFAGLHID
jgi:hypothetical protein